MRHPDESFCAEMVERFCSTRSKQRSSEWCEQFLNLNEPKIKGRFSFSGREYLRQIVDAWGFLPPELKGGRNFVFVGGTGVGKTIATVGGICSRIGTYPMRALIVKPTAAGPAGARSFSKTRLGKTIKATPCLAEKIPTGVDRYDFAAMQMSIGGSVIDLTGANSVGQLGENRCDVVLQDEIDKYPEQTEESKEASPIMLADERMKNVIGARGYKSSTPTLPNVGIWAIFKNTDQRRRFLPCPKCAKEIVLAWSRRFTIFELKGNEAFVKWDDGARLSNGLWDYDRVERSARYECPHCNHHIRPADIARMDKLGIWRPTVESAIPGEIGWHLPSLYSTSPDCAVGKLAIKFLKAKRSPEGVKSFINSDLAEPDCQQDFKSDKIGLAALKIEVTDEWLNTLTVDYQQLAPMFWWSVRSWNGSDKTHGIACGSANQWYEIDEIQKQYGVIPQAVGIDIGYDQAEVLRNCAAVNIPTRSEALPAPQEGLPIANGWNPMKAYGGKKMFRWEDSGLWLPYRVRQNVDPYAGTDMANKMRIESIEFLSDIFCDSMENIRMGKTNIQWTISPEMDTEEYHRHMSGKKRFYSKADPRAYSWKNIRAGFPDHLFSAELMSLVLACCLQVISFEGLQPKNKI